MDVAYFSSLHFPQTKTITGKAADRKEDYMSDPKYLLYPIPEDQLWP
jgi:hypothetical protein